ncbi:hypothetical protein ACFSE0_14120 [Ochrobactrum teleogrylli]|uniref:DUF945 domain-containing protein n=1 Tax=Ochrobactrum teleogrylli TaxID=2479765 RepID=A0ABY2Y4A7_9HYPH|nr:hypothetical protein [[Ochrobactrum] teleogrylli]TNV16191.1 hypothetical protein FIC94_10195 [[Ochrobactrum] teleogrylli]
MQVFVNIKPAARIFAASTALSLIFGSAAMAADANAVAERLKALYEKQGGELSFANVKADGSNIVLEGTKVKLATLSPKDVEVGDVTLEDVQDAQDGGFTIGQVVVPDLTLDSTDGKNDQASIKGMSMQNLRIPAESAKGPLDSMVLYDKMKIDELAFGKPGTDGATVKGIDVSLDTSNKAEKIGYSATVASIDATFGKDGQNPLEPLGMKSLQAAVNMKGQWSPKSGDATLDQMEVDAQDLGKINITGSLGGYDLAFVEAVQKTQEAMTKSDADKDAAGLAILGLAEQLNLKNLTIRFDDASLTEKLLTYYAKQQGSDAKALGEQLKMMVPLMATQLKNPEFAQQLKAASDKYFSDPKSLTLSASPDQPVTFASIVATASLDPTKIIQLLKVGIDANN